MPWVKGRSGNPRGRPSQRGAFAPLIRRVLTSRAGPGDPTAAEQIARALIDAAKRGDLAAIRFLVERVDGPAPRRVEGPALHTAAGRPVLVWPEGERNAEPRTESAPDSLPAG